MADELLNFLHYILFNTNCQSVFCSGTARIFSLLLSPLFQLQQILRAYEVFSILLFKILPESENY